VRAIVRSRNFVRQGDRCKVTVRVVKLGGSLLTHEHLVPTMLDWVARQSPAQTLVVVGGGEIVDAVRTLDKKYPLPSAQVHWMCVDLLRATHLYAATMFPQWSSIDSVSKLRTVVATRDRGTSLVSISSFYGSDMPEGASTVAKSLPSDWRTTTDALAGLLAVQVNADELVLLKSCEIPEVGILELAMRGIVDETLPNLANLIPYIRVEQLVMG
jgi:aspartokinase-like uncharacterized kinase